MSQTWHRRIIWCTSYALYGWVWKMDRLYYILLWIPKLPSTIFTPMMSASTSNCNNKIYSETCEPHRVTYLFDWFDWKNKPKKNEKSSPINNIGICSLSIPHTNLICSISRFPCAATVRLLIRCGVDVNAMDDERNTPLHVIVGYGKAIRYVLHGKINITLSININLINCSIFFQWFCDFTLNYNRSYRSWCTYGFSQ